jgi:hypothetical protein
MDPHRLRSYSKRQMRRFRDDERSKPYKVLQSFFVLDADTHQPVAFTIASSPRTVTEASKELLVLAADILGPQPGETLVLADLEHFTADLIDHIHAQTAFDLLVPIRNQRSLQKKLRAIPDDQFTRRWAGYATAKLPYRLAHSHAGPLHQFVQRSGERPSDYRYHAFLSTADRDEVEALTRDFPQRWHVEEFFNAHQALGWNRAGTLNLNIRYAQMTMALVAQTVLHQLRQRLGEPLSGWDAGHFAKALLAGLDGDIRVDGDTVVVT